MASLNFEGICTHYNNNDCLFIYWYLRYFVKSMFRIFQLPRKYSDNNNCSFFVITYFIFLKGEIYIIVKLMSVFLLYFTSDVSYYSI